ncbi:unnamed protein product [Prunus armeniaca]
MSTHTWSKAHSTLCGSSRAIRSTKEPALKTNLAVKSLEQPVFSPENLGSFGFGFVDFHLELGLIFEGKHRRGVEEWLGCDNIHGGGRNWSAQLLDRTAVAAPK